MNTKIIPLMASLALASCYAPEESGESNYNTVEIDDAGAADAPAEKPKKECKNSVEEDAEYKNAVIEYRNKWNMPEPGLIDNCKTSPNDPPCTEMTPSWSAWMMEHYDIQCGSFYLAQNMDKKVNLSVYYLKEPSEMYGTPWESEEAHMKALERELELTYPTWDFTLTSLLGLSEEEQEAIGRASDWIVMLGTDSSYQQGKHIHIHYEGIISHEMGHALRRWHHYQTLEEMGEGNLMPPGDQTCLMDRNDSQYCSAGRFALDMPMDANNHDELETVIAEINGHHADGY